MKFVYLILTLLMLSFSLKGQNLSENDLIYVAESAHLSDALDQLEQQTDYTFIYDARQIDLSNPVTQSITGTTLTEVLNKLFKGSDIVYTQINNQIILSRSASILEMQNQTTARIYGIVMNDFQEPLAGVNIWEKGTTNGTISNALGEFSLNLPREALIMASYIGFETKEVIYKGESSLRLVLSENQLQLDEVIITALGIEKKESSLPYSSQLLTGEELVRVKDVNMIHTLAGKMAGVQINRTSSGLGGSSRVIIRGRDRKRVV